MITKAFLAYGFGEAFVLVGIEGNPLWRKEVLPTLKRGLESLFGRKVLWKNIYIDGWIPIKNHDRTDWIDPIRFFHESHEQKKFNRLIIRGRYDFTVYHKGE